MVDDDIGRCHTGASVAHGKTLSGSWQILVVALAGTAVGSM